MAVEEVPVVLDAQPVLDELTVEGPVHRQRHDFLVHWQLELVVPLLEEISYPILGHGPLEDFAVVELGDPHRLVVRILWAPRFHLGVEG